MSIVPTSGTRASGAQFRSEDPATEFCVRIPGKDSFPRCVRGRIVCGEIPSVLQARAPHRRARNGRDRPSVPDLSGTCKYWLCLGLRPETSWY